MNISFQNKVVIVTGGSRGIGKQLVKDFSSSGAKVFFTYLNSKNESEILSKEIGEQIEGHRVDGRIPNEVNNFIEKIGTKLGKIDVLINNAGVVPVALLQETSVDTWDNTLNSNLNSVFNFCKSSLKHLYKSGSGVIVNVSSLTADRPGKGAAAYSASKGAIESLSRALAIEYAPFKIRVNSVLPGLIETDVADEVTNEFKQELIKRTPLKRIGTTEDVSNAVLFLASEKAQFITGTKLYITGGRHIV